MQLSTKGRYAVIALLSLYEALKNVSVVPLSYIAEKESISIAYLEQLFVRLRKAGLVNSVRGSAGGYYLAKEANFISLAEIIVAAEENIVFTQCSPLSPQGCAAKGALCKTHHLWEELSNQLFTFLDGVTLFSLSQGHFPKAQDSKWLQRKQVAND